MLKEISLIIGGVCVALVVVSATSLAISRGLKSTTQPITTTSTNMLNQVNTNDLKNVNTTNNVTTTVK